MFKKSFTLVASLVSIICTQLALANSEAGPPDAKSQSSWNLIKDKLRVRTFTEYMTPSFQSKSHGIPTPDGDILDTTNIFNIIWTDYQISENWKILYWQRFNTYLARDEAGGILRTVFRNPRFALRRTGVFKDPNLNTTYDFYLQPGVAPEGFAKGRNLEMGFRTTHIYSVPGTRLGLGGITELTFSPFQSGLYSIGGNPYVDAYGWAMGWVSYDLNSLFALQTVATINFEHQKGKSWLQPQWDSPMPFIQNGVSVNLSKSIWAAVFLNNYLTASPSLKNTWVSCWLSLTFL